MAVTDDETGRIASLFDTHQVLLYRLAWLVRVLVLDGQVVAAPTVRDPISESVILNGHYTPGPMRRGGSQPGCATISATQTTGTPQDPAITNGTGGFALLDLDLPKQLDLINLAVRR
jgi:hypothetical protein